MRKMFCTLGLGVWALCSQVMADAQSLLAKVPETYDFAVQDYVCKGNERGHPSKHNESELRK